MCLCFALHVEVQVYDGTPLKCIVCCTAVKVKTLPPQYFFIVISQEIGVFQRAVLPGDVLLVTSQLWIAYFFVEHDIGPGAWLPAVLWSNAGAGRDCQSVEPL